VGKKKYIYIDDSWYFRPIIRNFNGYPMA
jgi:hypothetical protein